MFTRRLHDVDSKCEMCEIFSSPFFCYRQQTWTCRMQQRNGVSMRDARRVKGKNHCGCVRENESFCSALLSSAVCAKSPSSQVSHLAMSWFAELWAFIRRVKRNSYRKRHVWITVIHWIDVSVIALGISRFELRYVVRIAITGRSQLRNSSLNKKWFRWFINQEPK